MNDWLEDLNPSQRQAVTHPPEPLLVLAGPGSGKTRILTRRVAWLVQAQDQAPESILAVTFTNRAAEEMRERLFHFLGDRAEGVWIHTFHAAALRILRKFGDRVGLPPDFIIADEDAQRLAVVRQLRLLNLSREKYSVGEIVARISQAKSLLQNPESLEEEDPAIQAVIRGYQAWLQETHALDFDDLLRYVVFLLRQEGEVRDFYHRALAHILVDEYQDINKAQYEFLTLLAPPGTSITAVADDDQTIYGWRGSDPGFVDAFIHRYNPTIIKLPYSYRCPPSILYGAQHLIAREAKPDTRRNYMQSRAQAPDTPIYHYIFPHVRQENAWLISLIRKLMAERGFRQGDIAILYRTHRLSQSAEQALIEAGFRVQRVRPRSFFQDPQVREIVRYLQMTRAITEENLTAAFHFPVRQVDEITMAQLRRLTQKQGITLPQLLDHSDDFPEITPLTRAYLRRLAHFARETRPHLESDAAEAVTTLFQQLEPFRSPWRQRDRELLAQLLQHTRMPDQALALRRAVDAGQPLVIFHDASPDAHMAAWLLHQALAEYARIQAPILAPPSWDQAPEQAEVIYLGDPSRAPAHRPWMSPPPEPHFPLTLWAWRWAQQWLMTYEDLDRGRFVFYDIETTGSSVRRDEIIELAAWAYEDRRPVDAPFHALVRPQRGYIPPAASRVHGIRFKDVADAPELAQVLPQFLDYIHEAILIGHNIGQFDNAFIDKACGELLNGRGFYPLYIDTLRLARRLLPDFDHYSLEHLSQALGLHQGPIQHRALEDLQVTADLFYLLAEYLRLEKEQESLREALPWVGLSLLASEDAGGAYREMLLDAAARVLAAGPNAPWQEDILPPAARPWRETLAQRTPRPTEEDDVWQDMRQRFLQHVQAFQTYGQDPSLRAFLDYLALLNSMDVFAHEAEADAITMMTLHNAKGAEFPVVIILGVEQENLPIWRSLSDPRKLAEERRVFYVGLTRARNAVYLFSTLDREDGFRRRPSPFAFEIPRRYIRHFYVTEKGKVQEIR